MKSAINNLEDIVNSTVDLVETKTEIWKLKAVGKISDTVSSIISIIAVMLLAGVSITILSFGVAYWIGNELGNLHYGFFIVGGFYAIVGVLLYFLRERLLKTPISNLIIDKITESDN